MERIERTQAPMRSASFRVGTTTATASMLRADSMARRRTWRSAAASRWRGRCRPCPAGPLLSSSTTTAATTAPAPSPATWATRNEGPWPWPASSPSSTMATAAQFAAAVEERDYRQTIHPDGTHPYVHSANLGFRLDAYLNAGGLPLVNREEDADLWRRLRRTGVRPVADAAISVATSARPDGRVREGFAHALNTLYARIDPRCRIGGTGAAVAIEDSDIVSTCFTPATKFDDQHIGDVDSSRCSGSAARLGNGARRLGERGRQEASVNAGAEVERGPGAGASSGRSPTGWWGCRPPVQKALQSGSAATSRSMYPGGHRHPSGPTRGLRAGVSGNSGARGDCGGNSRPIDGKDGR